MPSTEIEARKSTKIEEVFQRNSYNNAALGETHTLLKNNLTRLDVIINKLNPDAYYKNQPQCEGEGLMKGQALKPDEPLSGMLQEMRAGLNETSERISDINNNLITQFAAALDFLERHI